MENILEIIKERRSIRKYKKKNLDKKVIKSLIESVKWSPSWANSQCWELIVINDKDTRKKLQKTLPTKGNPAQKAMVDSSILFVFCGKKKLSGYYKNEIVTKFGDWLLYDIGIASQNLCLMAHSIGLGSVIVGLFNHDSAKQILKIPENYEVVTMVPIGFPVSKINPTKRKSISDFVHLNVFGQLFS